MDHRPQLPFSMTRRRYLKMSAASAAFFCVPGLFAEELIKTPSQTEGPFYPDKLPLDTDNDLLIINDGITPAVGEITHLTGSIVDANGHPLRNAVIEIWQVDSNGAYLHSGSDNRSKADKNFQGFGRFTTGSKGEYYFRTIKPVAYPGRTPHIHVQITKGGKELLTTQCYVKGEPQNQKDGIYRSLGSDEMKQAVTCDFSPMADSKIGELEARFDIVLGVTPEME